MALNNNAAGLLVLVLLLAHRLCEAHSARGSAQQQHQMMLDPRNPHHGSGSRAAKLQMQQRLAQQVQTYAAAHGTAHHQHQHQRPRSALIARALRGTTKAESSSSSRTESLGSLLPPPDSCFHSEQQLVCLTVDFNCSSPAVQGQSHAAFETKVCAAALKQLQQPGSTSDASSTQVHCSTSSSGCASDAAAVLSMDLSLYLPDTTCAVALQMLADQLDASLQLLFASDPDLAAAAVGSAASLCRPDSRLESLQAAIQSSANAILRALFITAEDVDAVQDMGGVRSGSEEEAGAALFDDSPTADDWMWDQSLSGDSLDMDANISIWAASVAVFGVGFVLGGLLLLHRAMVLLARRRADRRRISDVDVRPLV